MREVVSKWQLVVHGKGWSVMRVASKGALLFKQYPVILGRCGGLSDC